MSLTWQKPQLWHLNNGLQAAGHMFTKHAEYCGTNILTTNFDPLIEVAIREKGGKVSRTVLHGAGMLDHHYSDAF